MPKGTRVQENGTKRARGTTAKGHKAKGAHGQQGSWLNGTRWHKGNEATDNEAHRHKSKADKG